MLYIIIDDLIIETLDLNLVLDLKRAFVSLQNTIILIGYYTYIFFALLFMGSAILTPFANTLLDRFSLEKNPFIVCLSD